MQKQTCCVGPYMIVCINGNCAAGRNQKPMQGGVVSRDSKFADVGNDENPGGSVVGGV